jgi:hypothetical protein
MEVGDLSRLAIATTSPDTDERIDRCFVDAGWRPIGTRLNELSGHGGRMLVMLPASCYVHWLGDLEDPGELMRHLPSEAMRMSYFDSRQQTGKL